MIQCYEYQPNKVYNFLSKKVRTNEGRSRLYILERWISLDTETANNHDEENPVAWVYQWAFKFGDEVVGGRKPSELIEALRRIKDAYGLDQTHKVMIFVHNLSYDIQYLKDWLYNAFGQFHILAVRAHKFIEFVIDGFIFRCSWKLSNKSLMSWGKDLGTPHQKIEEAKDYYREIIYQDTPLTRENWAYMEHDVLVLDECIEKQFASYGDTVVSVPLTSTGYIRRTTRKRYKEERRNRKAFVATRLSPRAYLLERDAFAGGLTQGNRFVAGKTVRPETEKGEFIKHRDFRSHYPSQQRTRTFPVGAFAPYKEHATIDEVKSLMPKWCLLMRIRLENVTLKRGVVLPTISATRANKGKLTRLDTIEDNGRIIDCTGVFELVVTDLDLKWILAQYDIEYYDIVELWVSKRGNLPKFLTDTVDEFFLGKTEWKYKKAAATTAEDKIYFNMELLKSKNGLNGIYGQTATDPVRESYEMEVSGEWKTTKPDVEKALDDFYRNENNFNRYQWGTQTTSLARDELLFYADLITKSGGTVLYCDTDSIFYVSNDAVEAAIEKENERRKARALSIGAYIEYNGKIINYDSFDDEDEDIVAFRFLHAKCYAYEYRENGEIKLKCVIAGVTEFEDNTHEYTREMELGTIDDLTDGKVFERCGGTKAAYIETPAAVAIVNGHKTEIGSACVITDTTKTLHNELNLFDTFIEWERGDI